jgi:uncharacterized protein (UPF0218 family)
MDTSARKIDKKRTSTMRVNPSYVGLLKEPFGVLIKEKEIDKTKINQFVEGSDKIISVGDTTTEKLVGFGYIPDISVVDYKEKRSPKSKITEFQVDRRVTCENKPGEINIDVINLVKEMAMVGISGKMQIIIEGEEDLVALPFFMYSPNKWTIFYGQPNEGLVVVEANNQVRTKARLIFNKVFAP